MNISAREVGLGVATVATIMGLITYALVDSKYAEWTDMQEQKTQTERRIRNFNAAIKKEPTWSKELKTLAKDLRVFDSSETSVSPDLTKTLNTLAAKHGLDILDRKPGEEKEIGELSELGITLVWEGKLPAIIHFLTDIQNQDARYSVSSLTINPNKTPGSLKGSMKINCSFIRRDLSKQTEVKQEQPAKVKTQSAPAAPKPTPDKVISRVRRAAPAPVPVKP